MRASHLPGMVSVSASALLLALLLPGCSQPGRRVATDTPTPAAHQASTTVVQAQGLNLPHGWTLVTYTAAIPYAYQPEVAELKVSASCHRGERMVGVGYAATSVFEYNASIIASYPADDQTWVAIGGSQAGIELNVYCLHGDHLPTVLVVSGVYGAITCPVGSVLLAEGFGQQAAGAAAPPTAYTLCATSGVAVGATATAPVTFDSNHNGYMPVYASVTCPVGQLAFGGGTTGIGNYASGASADFTGWDITGGGQGSGSIYADCVRLV